MAKLNLSEIPLDAGEESTTAVLDEKVPHGTKALREELDLIELEIEEIGNPMAQAERAAGEYAALLEKQALLVKQAADMRVQIDLAIQAKSKADDHANRVILPRLNELTRRRVTLRKQLGIDKK